MVCVLNTESVTLYDYTNYFLSRSLAFQNFCVSACHHSELECGPIPIQSRATALGTPADAMQTSNQPSKSI